MKKKLTLIVGLIVFMSGGPTLAAFTEPSMSQYTALPVFSAQTVKPNIMIILDNSGSMNEPAYRGTFAGAPHATGTYPVDNPLDDMEGVGAPDVAPDSSEIWDLDLGEHPVGLRFQNIEIPQGARITSAYIEFVACDSDSIATSLSFSGEASDDALPFSILRPITSRTMVGSTVSWANIPAWTVDTHYNSPDIAPIIQEIVDRGGWTLGNSLVIRIDGFGERDAWSRDNSSSLMPILHISTESSQGRVYYGYFNPDYFYEYDSTISTFIPKFKKEGFSADNWSVRAFNTVNESLSLTTSSLGAADITAGLWDGNWLNWLSMRRTDVLRKVIVGGLSYTRGNGGKQTVVGEDPISGAYFEDWSKSMDTTGKMPVGPYHGNFSYSIANGTFSVNSTAYTIRIQKEPVIEPRDFDDSGELVGVLQRIGDKARWGNTWFNSGGWDYSGGSVANPIDGSPASSLISNLQDTRCTTSTPLAETMYVVTQYFKQQNVEIGLGYPSNVLPPPIAAGGANDPYYDKDADEMVSCAKSFAILLTDGGSTADSRIPNHLKDFDNDGNDASTCSDCSTNFLDDVALYARTQDLRSDLDDAQNLYLYTIFAFANDSTARSLLMDAARNGGFNDRNGNNMPDGDYTDPPQDRLEWDKDGDAIPDTYFEASDGYAMEARLLAAITDILKRAASGTAASVLSTNNQGAGNSVQAYFKPLVQEGVEEARWYGYMQALWVDPWGNLREDTNADGKLGLVNTGSSNTADSGVDKIIEYYFDENDDETKIRRYDKHFLYNPDNGSKDECEPPANCATSTSNIAMEAITPIFEAGKRLAERKHSRKIFTLIDKNQNSVVDSGEVIDFTTANASALKPYLGVRDGATWGDSGVKLGSSHDDRINNIINYIRGTEISGLRNRTLNGTTWKLGDIISSTPMMVDKPKEGYHELYGDLEYLEFIKYANTRETVIYTGANDGMLHAFTSWQLEKDLDGNLRYVKPSGAPSDEQIGDEIWAYIPQSLLPHLKWNAMTDYTHTYYVDGPVRVFDAKIIPDGTYYNDTNNNPDYGTFMIFGLGMGGKNITVNEIFGGGVLTERTFYPSYVLMDITDPRNPKLMWERTYEELGMTHVPPAPLHVGSRTGSGEWYLVFGSGPTDYDGRTSLYGHVFVVDLETGNPIGTGGKDWLATSAHNSYFNEPLVIDLFQSHNTDAIFMANNYLDANKWKSDIWKIAVPCTKCQWEEDAGGGAKYSVVNDELEYNQDPTTWVFNQNFFHTDGAVSAQLTPAMDEDANLLVYFGTGRYIAEDDKLDGDQQYMYAVKDPFYNKTKYESSYYHNFGNLLPLETADLLASDDIKVMVSDYGEGFVKGYGTGTLDFRSFVKKVRKEEDGWHLKLETALSDPSERIITQPAILGGIVLTPTFKPSVDICEMGGTTTFLGAYYETGTGYKRQLFELLQEETDTIGTETVSVVNVKDDTKHKGMPAPKTVFHSGKEKGAKISTQVGTGEFVNEKVAPAFYFKSEIAEWWDDPKQAPMDNDQCGW